MGLNSAIRIEREHSSQRDKISRPETAGLDTKEKKRLRMLIFSAFVSLFCWKEGLHYDILRKRDVFHLKGQYYE